MVIFPKHGRQNVIVLFKKKKKKKAGKNPHTLTLASQCSFLYYQAGKKKTKHNCSPKRLASKTLNTSEIKLGFIISY